MDTGFKRLWSRKKSWGAADQPGNLRSLSSSNNNRIQSPSSTSLAKDGRPSMASTRQHDRPFSQDKSSRSQDLANTIGEDIIRTKSGHRIQPMLVGISRPETANRPDTAGSLQSAVQRAADSVNRRPSEASTTQPVSAKSPKLQRVPSRHVDIFSIASSVPSNLSRYNEEIAERNIDTLRLALENTPYKYDPSSKYQEEVAIRNAYLPYKSRPSTDSIRRSLDYERTASMTARSVRSVTSPQQNGIYPYGTPMDSGRSNGRTSQDTAPHHVRSLSGRSHDSTQLPVMPQQYAEPDYATGLNITAQPPYSPTRSVGNHNTRDARMSTIQEGLPYEIRPISFTRTIGLRDSGHSSSSGFPDYKLTSVEYGSQPVSYPPTFNDRIYELQRTGDGLAGPPSTYSVASSTKRSIVLPNRTIMDLTNDDSEIFSEASSAFAYSQYSPVIEQARSDAFRRIEPSQIHTEERRGSKDPASMIEPKIAQAYIRVQPESKLRSVFDEYEPEIEAEPGFRPAFGAVTVQPQPIDTTVTKPEPEKRSPSVSAFSPISTVASWSPRSTVYIPSTSEAMTMTARVTAALEASRAIAKEPPVLSTTRKDNDKPTVKERVASYEINAERSNSSTPVIEHAANGLHRKATPPSQALQPSVQDAEDDDALTPRAETVPILEVTKPLTQESSNDKGKEPAEEPIRGDQTRQAAVQPIEPSVTKTPAAKVIEKSMETPSIYMSPESITSVDYTNPGNAFGVRTRDFAVSPIKVTPTAGEKASLPKRPAAPTPAATTATTPSKPEQKKTKKPRASKPATPAITKPKDSEFDEEAFALKRAQARAALEKLQRSLSEDFLTLPDRSTIKGKQRLVESQPATPAPALSSPEAKITGFGSAGQRPESMEKPPPSSFRTSREIQQQRSSLTSNRSLSTGSRSSRRTPAPSSLKNVEPAINPIDQNILSPALLQAIAISNKPPKSPGEISLSSFPVPSSSRPPSQPDAPPGLQYHNNSIAGVMKRRSSTRSQGSTASAYSIPLHMVPGRTSSVRDPVPEEIDTFG